jgi:hypothetical protein
MSKPRSRPPASGSRPARRSLVELTAAAVSAADEGLLRTPSDPAGLSPQDMQSTGHVAEPSAQAITNAAAPGAGGIRNPDPAESTAAIAVEAARDFQARVLEDMKIAMSAALDYAKGLAAAPMPAEPAQDPAADNEKTGQDIAGPEKTIPAAFGAAAGYRDEVLELMKTNVDATLEYAQQLANAKTPSQFVELSSAHARKQFELALKQTRELRSLAQTLAKPGGKDD